MTDIMKQAVQSDPSAATRRSRIVVAGTGSGAGKTTVTLGLMKAFADSGLRVQGFKCGPDYIDPTYHTAATGTPSRNLDSWMTSPDTVRETFIRASEGADISVIEGVMGLYDGKDPLSNTGSTAEIAMLTDSPVLLVVDVRSMARSAAAIVLGFQRLEPKLRIVGVIVNRCGSQGHYGIVKKAIEQECGIPVLGWLKRDDGLDIPERHLGLVPAVERGELEPLFQRAAELIRAGTDLDALRALADSAPPLSLPAQPLFPRIGFHQQGMKLIPGDVLSSPSPEMRRSIFTTRKIWICCVRREQRLSISVRWRENAYLSRQAAYTWAAGSLKSLPQISLQIRFFWKISATR